MAKCLASELKKALFQKKMYLVMTFVIILVLVHVRTAVTAGLSGLRTDVFGNPQITGGSAFIRWLGADTGSFESTVFYFLLPIIAALPFGWSLTEELHSGYSAQIITRNGRGVYFTSKLFAAFVSGAVIIILPLAMNFLIVSAILPSLTPVIIYPYGGLMQRSMWSDIYYAHPHIYVMLYILLDGLYGGLFAALSTASAFLFRYWILSVLFPFGLYVLVEYLDSNFVALTGFGYDVSPAKFLRSMAVANEHSGWVVLAEGLLLAAAIAVAVWFNGKKYEAI